MRGRNAEDGWKRGEWRGARPQPWVPPPHAPRALPKVCAPVFAGARVAPGARASGRAPPRRAHQPIVTWNRGRGATDISPHVFALPAPPRRRTPPGVARAGFLSPTRRNEKLPPSAGSPPQFARASKRSGLSSRILRACFDAKSATPRSRARRARGSARSRVATPVVPPSEKAHAGFDPSPARCRSNVERSLSRDTVDREPAISIGACLTGVDRRIVPPEDPARRF